MQKSIRTGSLLFIAVGISLLLAPILGVDILGCIGGLWGRGGCMDTFLVTPQDKGGDMIFGSLAILIGLVLLTIQFIKYGKHLPKERDYI